jgi:hypothetical protein
MDGGFRRKAPFEKGGIEGKTIVRVYVHMFNLKFFPSREKICHD